MRSSSEPKCCFPAAAERLFFFCSDLCTIYILLYTLLSRDVGLVNTQMFNWSTIYHSASQVAFRCSFWLAVCGLTLLSTVDEAREAFVQTRCLHTLLSLLEVTGSLGPYSLLLVPGDLSGVPRLGSEERQKQK